MTADDLWSRLCSYWHFINYQLLKFIIKNVAHQTLIAEMRKYELDLKTFFKETSLLDFLKCFPRLCREGNPMSSQPLEVKVNAKYYEFKLADLYHLEEAFVTTFSLPKICGFILEEVKLGCFFITWMIPVHYSKLLRWKLSICDEQFFENHDIQSACESK